VIDGLRALATECAKPIILKTMPLRCPASSVEHKPDKKMTFIRGLGFLELLGAQDR
jgi:hypothetical protein